MSESNCNKTTARTIGFEIKRLRMLGRKMSVSPTENRLILFELTKTPISNLLKFNENDQVNFDSIRATIAELAKVLLELRNQAGGKVTRDNTDGYGECQICASLPTRFLSRESTPEKEVVIAYCPLCSDKLDAILRKLLLEESGFGISRDFDFDFETESEPE